MKIAKSTGARSRSPVRVHAGIHVRDAQHAAADAHGPVNGVRSGADRRGFLGPLNHFTTAELSAVRSPVGRLLER